MPGQLKQVLELGARVSRLQRWVFWDDSHPDGRLRVRDEFADLVCGGCGKVDELAALGRAPLPGGPLNSKRDILLSGDDFFLVSDRASKRLVAANVCGVEFVPIARATYAVVKPAVVVQTDPQLAGFERHGGACIRCGRPKELCVGPLVRSLSIPENPLCLFTSVTWSESVRGRRARIFVTAECATVLKALGLDGLQLLPAH